MSKIDFVILWVDGGDPVWIAEKNKYSETCEGEECRYRDWNTLRFWFRGVEKYASFVNRIFFVTCGHIPEWLDTDNDKIRVVKHSDFIPEEYLPTFNSNTILLNLYRIKELSEQFVVFNDDMFLADYVQEDFFFKNGLPCDEFCLNLLAPTSENIDFFHMLLNNISLINAHFDKKKVLKRNRGKVYKLCYGKSLIKSMLLMSWGSFPGFTNPHIAHSYLKSIFERVAIQEKVAFDNTCKHRFRTIEDITEWIVRYYQLCEGKFYPRGSKKYKYFEIAYDMREIKSSLANGKYKLICINDIDVKLEFEKMQTELLGAFERALPEKSEFERG